MIKPTGLAGTTGVNCDLVRGDEWEEVNGSRRVDLSEDLTTNIQGFERRAVTQDMTVEIQQNYFFTVAGQTTDQRGGTHFQYNYSPRFETFFHTLSQEHKETSHINQPTSLLEKLNVSV